MKGTAVHHTLDHLFRHQYGSIVAGLTSRFGAAQIELIEDAVQEALLKAVKVWPFKGIPERPDSWLYRVAYNGMIDLLRKESKSGSLKMEHEESEEPAMMRSDREIEDEQLKMIFACCNPILDERDSLLLSLKLVGGFSVAEIARSLLIKEEAAKKSVQRARTRFAQKVKAIYFPHGPELENYLHRVLKVIYLVFNEGYRASTGDRLIKEDLSGEAIRLGLILSNHKYCEDSRIFSLLSLMCFKASRYDSRLSEHGDILLMEDQNRKKWNPEYIRWGFYYFNRATASQTISSYQLEAAIEYLYHIARDFGSIDWQAILTIYERLLQIKPTAITRLNYLVIFQKVHGYEKALPELMKLEEELGHNHLFYTVYGDFAEKMGDRELAAKNFIKARELCQNDVEQKFLEKRLAAVSE